MPSLDVIVHQAKCWQLLFCFLICGAKAEICGLYLVCRFDQISVYSHYSSAKAHFCCCGTPHGQLAILCSVDGSEASRALGCPWTSWRDHEWGISNSLLVGFLMESTIQWIGWNTQYKNPQMFSRSSSYHCSCLLLSPSHVAHGSVLWVVWETNQALWQHPMQFRKLDVHSYTLPFPHGINHEPRKMFLGTKMWCLAGRVIWVT